uniref:Reticulon domain-containing protein n=2 Tax=Caenorhabditis tropicalis TaxID=1561998 RepID=A0A1I7URB3_9PELO
MILGRKRAEVKKGFAQPQHGGLNQDDWTDDFEIPTMLCVLFYCAATYLTIFMTTQMFPNRRPLIFKDLRHADREFQRLAPVIEAIVGRVHAYLNLLKKKNEAKKA